MQTQTPKTLKSSSGSATVTTQPRSPRRGGLFRRGVPSSLQPCQSRSAYTSGCSTAGRWATCAPLRVRLLQRR